jgi:1,4-dihydroxy-2-naphthoyl-CoA hydrolase
LEPSLLSPRAGRRYDLADCPGVPPRGLEVTPELSRRALAGTFPGDLGIELIELDDDHVLGRLGVDRRHLHPGGYVHGGVWVAFADTVAAWGTMRHLQPKHDFTTVEIKINVFAAAGPGEVLEAVGRPLHVGRSTQAWEVRVLKGERTAAFYTCTQMVLPGRPSTAERVGDGHVENREED